MNTDQQEALQRIARRPKSLAVLAEDLGLSGDTDEIAALCAAVDGLTAKALIERDTTPGFMSVRWRITSLGLAALDTETHP